MIQQHRHTISSFSASAVGWSVGPTRGRGLQGLKVKERQRSGKSVVGTLSNAGEFQRDLRRRMMSLGKCGIVFSSLGLRSLLWSVCVAFYYVGSFAHVLTISGMLGNRGRRDQRLVGVICRAGRCV